MAAESLEDMDAAIKLGDNGSHRLGSVDELTDGTGGSVNAVTERKADHIGDPR